MSALAEQWYEEDPSRGAAPAAHHVPRRRSHPAEEREPAGGWNVLAEELVCFPSRAQRIWLEREQEETTSYADRWLEHELESLRRRKVVAFTSSAAAIEPAPAAPARPFEKTEELRRPRAHPHGAKRPGTAAAAALPGATRGLRRLLPGAAALAALVVCWFGIGAMAAAATPAQHSRLPGSVPVRGGFTYVARPGDTLWSIASRAEPGSDPRPLVDQLEGELDGRPLEPGTKLVLPG